MVDEGNKVQAEFGVWMSLCGHGGEHRYFSLSLDRACIFLSLVSVGISIADQIFT